MSFQSILSLTCPTEADTLKAQVMKSLETVTKVVYAEGMVIPDDSDELEEEMMMWVTQWECILVYGGIIQVSDETDTLYQAELESCLRKAREHSVEACIVGHIASKMQEVNPMYVCWQEEVTVWHEAEEQQAEETQ